MVKPFSNTYAHLSGDTLTGTHEDLDMAAWTPKSCEQCFDGFLEWEAKGTLCQRCQNEEDEFLKDERIGKAIDLARGFNPN